MSAQTTSERIFLHYCKEREYPAKRITTEAFPDFEVTTPAGLIVMEIKELAPNDDDKKLFKTLEREGRARWSNAAGKRVEKAIKAAAPQLRRYKETSIPEVLLLYDNVVINDYHPWSRNHYLDPIHISAGMFGSPIIRFWKNTNQKPINAKVTHGGGRHFTEKVGLHIGAIGVLNEATIEKPIQIDFFHNPFTTKPVYPCYFPNPYDRHYIKVEHPDECGWGWSEFVGSRTNTFNKEMNDQSI